MLLRGLGEHAAAVDHFHRAYAVNPRQKDVGREYAAQYMIVGNGADALRVSKELHARFPDDAGLQSNLALAHLIAGNVDEALAIATDALSRDRDDEITKNLVGFIEKVKSGAIARPTRMPGF
jgi:Flp pilus assembly protein TadD